MRRKFIALAAVAAMGFALPARAMDDDMREWMRLSGEVDKARNQQINAEIELYGRKATFECRAQAAAAPAAQFDAVLQYCLAGRGFQRPTKH